MWPSLGLVHGMRITNDNNRSFERFKQLCYECFRRNWQNGVLWVNDPDTVLIKNKISSVMGPDGKKVKTQENVTSDEYMFCAAYVLASGGMILSSDDITSFTEEEAGILKKMLPPTSVATEFNSTLEIGSATLQDGKRRIFIFNYSDYPKEYSVRFYPDETVQDFWTGNPLPTEGSGLYKVTLNAHTSKVLLALPNSEN